MAGETLFITTFVTLMAGGMGSLFWTRLNRIEARLDAMTATISTLSSTMATRAELAELRSDVSAELAELRSDVSTMLAELRSDVAAMRSDLTHVALAVGLQKPKASEA